MVGAPLLRGGKDLILAHRVPQSISLLARSRKPGREIVGPTKAPLRHDIRKFSLRRISAHIRDGAAYAVTRADSDRRRDPTATG